MPVIPVDAPTLRIGAPVLLLDPDDRVLLIHAKDPDAPEHHWWELPGGGSDPDEALADRSARARRGDGIHVERIGAHLWDRETRFHYRGREHHRRESVYLGRIIRPCDPDIPPTRKPVSSNTAGGPIPNSQPARDKLLPLNLPTLFANVLNGVLRRPVLLHA